MSDEDDEEEIADDFEEIVSDSEYGDGDFDEEYETEEVDGGGGGGGEETEDQEQDEEEEDNEEEQDAGDEEDEEDEEDEGQEERRVRIEDDADAPEKRSMKRQGTGFVARSDLPPEEEEDEEDEGQEERRVRIEDEADAPEKRSMKRQGTAFVPLSALPEDEQDEEGEEDEEQVESGLEEGVVEMAQERNAEEALEEKIELAEDLKAEAAAEAGEVQDEEIPEIAAAEAPIEAEEEEELTLAERRARFEGKGDAVIAFSKREDRGIRSRPGDVFRAKLREKGGGSITVAWRRFFDSDGDGELSFSEFCTALTSFNHQGDVLRLWRDLAGPAASTLTLEVVDPEGAAILAAFEAWCNENMGGPTEVFKAIDDDGSDSLTAGEFSSGLESLGFFDADFSEAESFNVKEKLGSKESVLQHLWPLVDTDGRGCVTADMLLFLEKDPKKKQHIQRELLRMKTFGAGSPEPLRNESQKIIHKLVIQTTALGNRHWSQLKDGHVAVGKPMWAAAKSKERRVKKVSSEPSFSEPPLDLSFLEALGTGSEGPEIAASPQALPPISHGINGSKSSPGLGKMERKKMQLRRKAYCASLIPPLPYALDRKSKKATPAAGEASAAGEEGAAESAYPPAQHDLQRRKVKAKGPSFNPKLTQDFLSATKRDQLWLHYLAEPEDKAS